jgi:hypothetical protein
VNPELQSWQNATFPDGKLHNAVVKLIVSAVWPDAGSWTEMKQSRVYGHVRDVIDGHPVPTLSRNERAAIEAAARPILAGVGR